MRRALFTLVLLGGVASSGRVLAFPPCPFVATVPRIVRLVGADHTGRPDPNGTFTVLLRDWAGFPLPGETVVLDFSSATDAALCDVQPGYLVRHGNRVEGRTGEDGQLSVAILGRGVPGAPASGPQAVTVFFECQFPYGDIVIGRCACAVFDLNGSGGVSAADLSVWLKAFVSGANPPICDYDGSGSVGAADISAWLTVFAEGGSAQTCPSIVEPPPPPPPPAGEWEPRESPRPKVTGP